MGEIFKRNWKRVTGIRPDDTPQPDDLARLSEASGIGSGGSGGGGGLGPIEIKTTDYTVTSGDNGKMFTCTGGFTEFELPETPSDGFQILVFRLTSQLVCTTPLNSTLNYYNTNSATRVNAAEPSLNSDDAFIHWMYSAASGSYFAIAQHGTVETGF